MKISEEDKKLVLEVERIFPEIWKFLQREANRNTPFEDVLWALRDFHGWKRTVIKKPWALLAALVEYRGKKRERKKDDKRVEEWEGVKIQSEEDLKNWLRGVEE